MKQSSFYSLSEKNIIISIHNGNNKHKYFQQEKEIRQVYMYLFYL